MSRQRRPVATAVLAAVALLGAVLAVLVTPWTVAVVPFALVGACGTWLGLSDDELLGALETAGDDVGRGPAGIGP